MASKASGKQHNRRMRVWLGAATLVAQFSVVAPSAFAGAEQDTEQAEKEFARGNLVASMALWRKSAQEGYAPAQARLGDILDTAEEDEEAVSWYRKAAQQGNAAGEYGLGQMYAKGEGVKQDYALARSHTLRAAEKGHLPAMLQALQIYRGGAMGGTVDPAQATAWETKVKAAIGSDKLPQADKPAEKKNDKKNDKKK